MLDFLMNDKEYFVRSNNQLSVILSQFDSDYVMDVIEDTLARSLNSFDLFGPPNAVESYEEVFKEMMVTYPDEVERINESRMEVYRTIIDTICKHMDLQFNEASDVDLYTMARCMYDFFVSRLNNYIVTFYERYITSEKDSIYSNFHLEDMRKNKDMGTAYSRAAFGEGDSISLIVANLQKVISALRNMPVTDDYIYRTIYGANNEHIVQLMVMNLSSHTSIFNLFNRILFNENMYPTVITHIRMAIQQAHRAEIMAAAEIAKQKQEMDSKK
jgi:hypothetical protein